MSSLTGEPTKWMEYANQGSKSSSTGAVVTTFLTDDAGTNILTDDSGTNQLTPS